MQSETLVGEVVEQSVESSQLQPEAGETNDKENGHKDVTEDMIDIKEHGFYLRNVQGVLKFDTFPGRKRKRMSKGGSNQTTMPRMSTPENEPVETDSDDDGKHVDEPEESVEDNGCASSTETMSSEDERDNSLDIGTPTNSSEKSDYQCKLCEFKGDSEEATQLHYSKKHVEANESAESNCNINDNVAYSVKSNVATESCNADYLFELSQQGRVSFNCPFCVFSCVYKRQMCRHIRIDHGNEILECDSSQDQYILTEGSLLDQNELFKEDLDNEGSPIANRLRRRRRIQLDSIAKEHSILARILEERHQDTDRFSCELCQFKSSFRYAIISHLEVQHGASSIFTCDSCDYLTHSDYLLKRHTNAKHAEKKVYKCKSCDYTSARRYTMRSHIDSVHRKIKPFSCSQCNYSAARRDALKMHVTAIHEGKRPFSCSECSFSSSRKYLLKNHVKSYHGPCAQEELEKMFTCAVCGLMAKTSSALKDHLSAAHNGSTKSLNDSEDAGSYACDLCNFKCHRRTNLYSHRKAMHAGPDASRKHPCPFCFYFAYKITGLKGHITKCHKDCSYTDIDRIINGT